MHMQKIHASGINGCLKRATLAKLEPTQQHEMWLVQSFFQRVPRFKERSPIVFRTNHNGELIKDMMDTMRNSKTVVHDIQTRWILTSQGDVV